MTDPKTPEAIKARAKIEKLLALGQSSNEHEAALAMSMAQQIALQHGLDLVEIERPKEPKLDWIQLRTRVSNRYYEPTYYAFLINAVAEFCPIHSVQWGTQTPTGELDEDGRKIMKMKKQGYVGVGFSTSHEPSIELAKSMFEYLDGECRRRYKATDDRVYGTAMEQWYFKRGFFMAFANSVLLNAKKVAAERRTQTIKSTSTGRSLVVGDWLQQQRDLLHQLMAGGTVLSRSSKQGKVTAADLAGRMMGARAGKEVGFDPQLKNKSSAPRLS